MKPRASNPGAGISRGMLLALIGTLILVALSYGVRFWRESRSAAATPVEVAAKDASPAAASVTPQSAPVAPEPAPAPVAVAASPTPATSAAPPAAPTPAAASAATSPGTPENPANPMVPPGAAANPAPAPATNNTPPAPPPPGLRPVLPGASNDAMASRKPPAPPAAASSEPAPPPPPPPPPPPTFRLIGRYIDSPNPVAFFAHENTVIAAKPGSQLPGGFKLKAIRGEGVTVVRQSNKEKIEMNLETPK